MGYSYYDTPEGEDCFKKLFYTSKIAAYAGVSTATLDCIYLSHPQGYYQTLARYGYFTIPFLGMAAAFTSTVCVATSIRKKDDYLNYFLGGVAAGCVGGMWRKSVYNGVRLAMVFGIAALLKKSSIEDGWEFFPQHVRQTATLRTVSYDYTLTAERPRDWVTSEPNENN